MLFHPNGVLKPVQIGPHALHPVLGEDIEVALYEAKYADKNHRKQ